MVSFWNALEGNSFSYGDLDCSSLLNKYKLIVAHINTDRQTGIGGNLEYTTIRHRNSPTGIISSASYTEGATAEIEFISESVIAENDAIWIERNLFNSATEKCLSPMFPTDDVTANALRRCISLAYGTKASELEARIDASQTATERAKWQAKLDAIESEQASLTASLPKTPYALSQCSLAIEVRYWLLISGIFSSAIKKLCNSSLPCALSNAERVYASGRNVVGWKCSLTSAGSFAEQNTSGAVSGWINASGQFVGMVPCIVASNYSIGNIYPLFEINTANLNPPSGADDLNIGIFLSNTDEGKYLTTRIGGLERSGETAFVGGQQKIVTKKNNTTGAYSLVGDSYEGNFIGLPPTGAYNSGGTGAISGSWYEVYLYSLPSNFTDADFESYLQEDEPEENYMLTDWEIKVTYKELYLL